MFNLFEKKFKKENSTEKQNCSVADEYFKQAEKYNAQKEPLKAISHFSLAIKLCPSNPIYYCARGSTYYFHFQNYSLAKKDFEKALKLMPEYGMAYLQLGFIYRQENSFKKMVKCFLQAIKYGCKGLEYIAHYDLGEYYLQEIRDFEKAISCFDNAIQINPDYTDAYFHRGLIFCDFLNDYKKAVLDFDKVIELEQNNKFYYHYCGYAYVHKAEITAKTNKQLAIKEYDRAILMYENAHKLEFRDSETKEAKFSYFSTVDYAKKCKNRLLNEEKV